MYIEELKDEVNDWSDDREVIIVYRGHTLNIVNFKTEKCPDSDYYRLVLIVE